MTLKHFVELAPFKSYLDQLSDGPAVLREIQRELTLDPEKGDLVQGTGGIRKLRIAKAGRGKSAGFRIWYLHLKNLNLIYLIVLYAKNESENLTPSEKAELKSLVEFLKKEANRV